jgi:hypothetical protein
LASEFDFDVTQLRSGDAERMVVDMREVLTDPIFVDTPQVADLQLAASNAPGFARAFLDLHRAYRDSTERLAALNEALGRDTVRTQFSPWEEVRDFFHYCDNYIDAVDHAAEHFASQGINPTDHLRQNGVTLIQTPRPCRCRPAQILQHKPSKPCCKSPSPSTPPC